MTDSDSLGSRLKRAFKWHWHLLGLGAGCAFALLSGQPGAVLPLLAAGELAYLGFLGLNPRFQAVLRGQALIGRPGAPAPDRRAAAERFQKISSFLSRDDFQRFETLRQRCAELLDLRRRMDAQESGAGVENFRSESLDRMLWLFLKLLHQKACLDRFLRSTSRAQIEGERRAAETQLRDAEERDKATGIEGRLTASIRDRVATIDSRLDNHKKATDALELAQAEIDKTEQQITHLCEVGMTSRDSAGLSAKIDSISESIQSSEQTFSHPAISDLLDDDDQPPPPLLATVPTTPPPIPKAVGRSVSQ